MMGLGLLIRRPSPEIPLSKIYQGADTLLEPAQPARCMVMPLRAMAEWPAWAMKGRRWVLAWTSGE